MTITVFHLKRDLDRDVRTKVTWPLKTEDRRVEARKLFEAGGYEQAAVVEGNDLEIAFRDTNNISGSWSQEPARGVTPTAPGYIEHAGRKYGYKSSEVGDVFRDDDTGTLYVVDSFGFAEI